MCTEETQKFMNRLCCFASNHMNLNHKPYIQNACILMENKSLGNNWLDQLVIDMHRAWQEE